MNSSSTAQWCLTAPSRMLVVFSYCLRSSYKEIFEIN
jgi:hypothetical protein